MKKRILSLLLTLVMVFSLIPTTAWADDTTVSASVNIIAQAEGAFLVAPQYNVTVNSDLAEAYGYTDSIDKATSVSALDVLVKAHELIFGDVFTTANKDTYLAIESNPYGAGASVKTIFGETTYNSGFALNGAYPNDGTTSTYDGYNGTTVFTQAVVTGDTLDFFIYQDATYYSDNISWFCDADGNYISSLSATAGGNITLMVKGTSYMRGYLYKDATALRAAGSAIANAKLSYVNADTGTLTTTGGTTDSNGKITMTAPGDPGTYYLTAYTEGAGATPLIMAVLPITSTTTGGSDTPTPTPAKDTLTDLKIYSSNTDSGLLTLTPTFASATTSYSVLLNDYASTSSLYAAATPGDSEKTVTASWTDNSNAPATAVVGTTRTQLKNCTRAGATTRTVTLTVGEGDSATAYTVDIKRTPSLKTLTIEGAALNETFKNGVFNYTVDTTAASVTLAATGYATGYTVTYNDSDSGVISLTEGANTVIVKVSNPDNGLSTSYTVTINRRAVSGVTFNTTPATASVVVYDSKGNVVPANDDGSYSLMNGATYSYAVTCKGYQSKYVASYTASAGTVDVTLTEITAGTHNDVSAAWKNFRNSDVNMGITTAKTPTSAETATLKWAQLIGVPASSSNGWKGSPASVQIIVNNSLIVMSGTTLYKLSLADGSIVKQATMKKSAQYVYTPPIYAEGLIICPLENGTIQAFDATTLESVWVYTDPLGGQSTSPITYSNGYIYTGFWTAETGKGNYVCLSLTDEDSTKTDEVKYATWSMTVTGGFYWAGSVVVGNALIVGCDDGTSSTGTSYLYALNKATGKEITRLELTNMGDQRSSIAYDSNGGRVYFTTKGGYLCSAKVDATTGMLSDLKSQKISKRTTSTPIVYGDYVYVCGGGGVIEGSGGKGNFFICKADDLSVVKTVALTGYPQCSPLLSTAYKDSGYLYFYCTYNTNPGGISLIKVKTADQSAELVELYTPEHPQYCICSIICDAEGTLYYMNDTSYVFAVSDTAVLNQSAADAVTAKINAIGTVTLNSESKITAARSAYNALTATQKTLVSSDTLALLTAAETTLATLKEQKAAADKAAADVVVGKINAVTTAISGGNRSDINAAITAARDAYDDLTAAQQALVTNYNVLTAAEKTYSSGGHTVNRRPSASTGTANSGTTNTDESNTVKSPGTGDSSHMVLWMSGMLLSAAVLVLLAKKKRSAQ